MESLYKYQNQILGATEFLFRRDLIDQIDWNERLTGVIGPRGVGKTTCLLQFLSEQNFRGKSSLYVTLDNLANPYNSLTELAEEFQKQGGKQLIIDEIHKYPKWAAELKNIYDLFPGLKVVFSGSSMLQLHTGGTDLSRRAVIYNLNGLSFREYLQIALKNELPLYSLDEIIADHEKISITLCKKFKPFEYFRDYLNFGYFPFFLQSVNSYHLKLQGIINFIIENEIPVIYNIDIRNIQKIKKVLQIIAVNVPFQPNITKLSETLEMNRNTLLQYLIFLERTGIIISLYHTGSFYGKLSKPGKILLRHPNLAFALASGEVNQGSIRESFFVNQLIVHHKIELADRGDFIADDKLIFEIGGKGKTRKQIAGIKNSYLVIDDIEYGFENKIPLWLFGFLY
ncbi:MAG: AAA family ATPase [Bacteroidetes bacterium]|nr:AAA family ATPase [Bacteroidota bacterium]